MYQQRDTPDPTFNIKHTYIRVAYSLKERIRERERNKERDLTSAGKPVLSPLGYTISDLHPDIHRMFTTKYGQFIAIFVFLVSGLVKFKNNNIIHQILFMFVLSILSVWIIQIVKDKINNNRKKDN